MSFLNKNKIKLFFALVFVLFSFYPHTTKAQYVPNNQNPEDQFSQANEQRELDQAITTGQPQGQIDEARQRVNDAAAENSNRNNPPAPSTETCSLSFTSGINFGACFRYILAYILSWLLWALSAATWIASAIFTLVVDLSINAISAFGKMDLVTGSWRILRDLANMFALLIMMYIAIGTILQLDGVNWKKMIGSMIIAVILINFSMAFTGIIIDTSNIFAVYFYDKAKGGPDGNLSETIMAKLDIARQIASGQAAADSMSGTSSSGQAVPSVGAIILNSVGTLLFMIAFVFVLFTASALFIVRTITLIFSLIFSPLPWIAMIVPKFGSKIDNDYWGTLINQAFFAPAFMFCLWLTTRIIVCGDVLKTANLDNINIPFLGGSANVILFNVLVIGFLTGSLVVAKKMGAAGASGAEKFGKWATGAVVGGVGMATNLATRGANRFAGSYMGEGKGTATEHISSLATDQWKGAKESAWFKSYEEKKKEVGAIGGGLVGEAGEALYDTAALKVGMAIKAAKETPKSPTVLAGSLLKSVTGFDIISGAGEVKEAEKAEKEYKEKKRLEEKKTRFDEINTMDMATYAKENGLSADETGLEEAKRLMQKEITEIMENFRGDKLFELGLDKLKKNKEVVFGIMNENQIKSYENKEGIKPEFIKEVENAIFNNPQNRRGQNYVANNVIERNWFASKKDETGKETPVWTDDEKISAIRKTSSRNIANLGQNIFLNQDGTVNDIIANALHEDDLKELNKAGRKELVDKIRKRREELQVK